ncbi:MAG TPA: MFS transporter [Solirubrobacterales bacterium]
MDSPIGSPGQSRTKTASLLVPVYVPTFFLAFSQGITIPTLPLYAQLFTSSFGLISIAVSAAALGTLIADVPVGMMMARVGRKPLMIVGTAALAASSLLLALAHVYPEIIAYRLVFGAGTAMWNISRMAYITEVIPVADRGRALSTFGGITRIGVFAGPAVGGFIGELYGLNVPFFAGAALAAGALVISGLFVPESHTPMPAVRPHLRWRVVGDVARHHWRDLSTAGAAQIFAQMIRAGRQTIVPLYGATVLGLDVAAIGTIVSLSSAIDMSLFIPAGFIMDRLGRKFASVPSFTILGLGMALIPFAHDYAGLLLATCVMALGNGLGSGAMMTLGADLAPREATGEFLGVWRLIGDIGGTGGPLVVGGAADALGLGFAAFALAGIGFFAAATLVLFVRETLTQPG